MNLLFKISILIILVSCNTSKDKPIDQKLLASEGFSEDYFVSNSDLFSFNEQGFNGKDTILTCHYTSGRVKSRTSYALNKENEISNLKIGLHEVYNDEGKRLEIGQYQIGQYTNCCTGSLCKQFYSYKIDNWKYNYPNGKVRMEILYNITKAWMDTSCEGGSKLKFGKIDTSKSKSYDEKGNQISFGTEQLKDLQTVKYDLNEYQKVTLTLVNGKIIEKIEMK